MTRPTIYLLRMLGFLVGVGVVAALLSDKLILAFATNPILNSLILFVGVIGIAWNLGQVLRLSPEVRWLEAYRVAPARAAAQAPPRLLAPMASMLAARDGSQMGDGGERRFMLSAAITRSMLDSLASRLDESRELSRYMTALLIFLGLLGTFWGLLLTVGAVSDVIGAMSVGSGDINSMFEQLKSGLAKPLHGMGTAFSSSMFGLSGSLVLGFLDLTAGQAQNRFFNELEEWLAGLTRVSSGILGEAEAPVPVFVQVLLEQTAENLENLQRILTRGEEGRVQSNQAVIALTERLGALSDTMRATQPADTVQHLRNLEAALADLRGDIRLLTRAVAARADL